MPTRRHQSYSDLRTELETCQWLLRESQRALAAHEATAPDDLALQSALAYADGLGGCKADRVPLRILAAAVRALRSEQRLAKRLAAELRRRAVEAAGDNAEAVAAVFDDR